MPFDNSQYPDRRFKRSRMDSDVTGNSEDGNPLSSAQGTTGEGSSGDMPHFFEWNIIKLDPDISTDLHRFEVTSS